jgi:hypothetical protein
MQYIVISVIGSHAGESEEQIFLRKLGDIRNAGKTFWVINSNKVKPDIVQKLCKEAEKQNQNALVVFVGGSSSSAAKPTKTAERANQYSKDKTLWEHFPENLSPVTGKIDKGTCALVFNHLEFVNDNFDFWDYADFSNEDQPIITSLFASSVCASRKNMANHPNKMKSHNRRIIAIGRFCEPYGVWLR